MTLAEQVLAASRQADREQPARLVLNRNVDCYQHTTRVIEILKGLGLEAAYIGKTRGEGQYTPPIGFPRTVGVWTVTGVSHDAIWIAGARQFDLIGGGNDGPDPYPQPATPVANEIPPIYHRPNNPPVDHPITGAPTPPPAPVYPTYEELGGDSGGIAITRQLEADYKRAGRPGLDGDCGAWQQRVSYDFLTRAVPTVQASITKHRAEWCAALGIPVV
jgi:hypothetical protein